MSQLSGDDMSQINLGDRAQAGQVTATHRKGQLEGYTVTFRFRKPDTGAKTYKVWMAASRAA